MATPKAVVPRRRAIVDVEEAVDFYLAEAGEQPALDFIDDLEAAYAHIARHPATGSPRYAHELDVAGLRCWRLRRFPHLVFYFEASGHIDVWRVLHGSRQMADWLHTLDG
ncbi:type II toxin-antitoxin system RelE/ParE family toxin [Caenimonas sp. SL110]|uniref:type II toxin-antitoxin system RelE/ParE family toxin n=1 Tax=Caenimonas sp. SL110 TaxID=1450524 RepID=UPI00065286D1|nr:type II toxin-antitoxin system RelE/ParE family toxin [Caenimonas sp. SL110]